MANLEKLGLRIDNPCRIALLSSRMNKCSERDDNRHFWNVPVFTNTMIPRCLPESKSFYLPWLCFFDRFHFQFSFTVLSMPSSSR